MNQSFLVTKRKKLKIISQTKPNTVQLTINYYVFAATKPRSEFAVVVRLELPDLAELLFAEFV